MVARQMVMIGQRTYTLAERIEDLQNYLTGATHLITYDRSVRERVGVITERVHFPVFTCLFGTGWGPQPKLAPIHLPYMAGKLQLHTLGPSSRAVPFAVITRMVLKSSEGF